MPSHPTGLNPEPFSERRVSIRMLPRSLRAFIQPRTLTSSVLCRYQ
jgi:hypothetical protein